MRLLVLGGTLFLGRHLVDAARAGGHDVTLFNRGRTDPDAFPDVENLRGDRETGDLSALEGRRWDAVIDTSGYLPRVVRQSAELLRDAVERYVFVSSASAYADFSRTDIDEEAPVRLPEDPASENVEKDYGGLKTLCEAAVREALPGREVIVRAGLIVGPHDPTERFTWWVRRVARGGEVLAPGAPERQVQLIHARDLADWMIGMAEAGAAGTYNAIGPERRLSMGEMLDACLRAAGSDARFTWVDDAFLLERQVAPFTELPLWLPPGWEGMLALDVRRAVAAGLRFRSVEDTARDTLAWDLSRSPEQRRPRELVSGFVMEAGLAPEREAELLREWRTRARALDARRR